MTQVQLFLTEIDVLHAMQDVKAHPCEAPLWMISPQMKKATVLTRDDV